MVAPRRYGAGKQNPPGSVRIIGGRLRGSKLPVAERAGLRPSSDRVRETLFNWLQHELHGARVLDMFAGSGALGFEAVSRGAVRAVLVERDTDLAAQLEQNARRLQVAEVEVRRADALAPGTLGADEQFDGVFIDPPFEASLWERALLAALPCLAPRAWLYLESPPGATLAMPAEWRLHREGATREARYALYRRGE